MPTPNAADSLASIALYARSKAEADKVRNRLQMPETAARLDDLRAYFGKPDYIRVWEGDRVVERGVRPEWLHG